MSACVHWGKLEKIVLKVKQVKTKQNDLCAQQRHTAKTHRSSAWASAQSDRHPCPSEEGLGPYRTAEDSDQNGQMGAQVILLVL